VQRLASIVGANLEHPDGRKKREIQDPENIGYWSDSDNNWRSGPPLC
jgi:hypothetical protein